MTNATIVLMESIELMKQGKINGTGKFATIDGMQFEIPEEIHTYSAWKSMGYQVKRGSKSVASFPIWKYRVGKSDNADTEEVDTGRMFMKTANFFTINQVEKI